VNRKKAAKKKSPTPLTADMLNELNKNHMGGLENYGADDMYNIDDTWDERRQDVKPKAKVRTRNSFTSLTSTNLHSFSVSQTPSTEAIQTSMTVGGRNICSAIKPMSSTTIHMIHSTNFSQSTRSNRIHTAEVRSASWSQHGRRVLILPTTETVVTIIVLGD
jgi:hypothetical protein